MIWIRHREIGFKGQQAPFYPSILGSEVLCGEVEEGESRHTKGVQPLLQRERGTRSSQQEHLAGTELCFSSDTALEGVCRGGGAVIEHSQPRPCPVAAQLRDPMIHAELLPYLSVVPRVWVYKRGWNCRPQKKRVPDPQWGDFRLGDTELPALDCTVS